MSLSSAAALPHLQGPAATALEASDDGTQPLAAELDAAHRGAAVHAVHLVSHRALWRRSGGAAGRSNHEDGLAIDTSAYSSWITILRDNGFRWFGTADDVHFDYTGGADAQGVLAFQRLWNANNPGDKIGADGVYGPQTEARIKVTAHRLRGRR